MSEMRDTVLLEKRICMSTFIGAFLVWYALGIAAVGALFAGMVWDGEELPTKGRHWVWIFALLGGFLFATVLLLRSGDFRRGFVLTDRGAKRLKEKIERRRTIHG
jgi:hypothetical protein